MKKENLEVILEDINGKFNLVLEGYDALRSEMREGFQRHEERFDFLDFKIDTLNKKIDDVDLRLGKKIDDVDLRLSKKIDDVDLRLSNKIEAVEIKLSKQIDAVDLKLSKKIDAVAADLSAHRADTEAHHSVYLVKESE